MVSAHRRGGATVQDLAGLERHEILDGEIVEKAMPSFEHGDAQGKVRAVLDPYARKPQPLGPGGWWLGTEVTIELETHEVVQPDVAGWRRERVPERPRGYPVRVRPDWICEVLSPSDRARDLVSKLRVYQRRGVGHYWIVDPAHELLTVHRWTSEGYLMVLAASAEETVRAEPFGEIDLFVGALFGKEPPEIESAPT